jgi:hypothetical protein
MTSEKLDRERLTKLLGMLGSDHDGEIAAAGRAADRLVRGAGLRWPDIVQPALPPPGGADTIDDPIRFVLAFVDVLNDWEKRFAAARARQHRPPSPKQLAILDDLVAKCRAAARARA